MLIILKPKNIYNTIRKAIFSKLFDSQKSLVMHLKLLNIKYLPVTYLCSIFLQIYVY